MADMLAQTVDKVLEPIQDGTGKLLVEAVKRLCVHFNMPTDSTSIFFVANQIDRLLKNDGAGRPNKETGHSHDQHASDV